MAPVLVTEELISKHVELLLVQAPLGDGGELPAQDVGQLRPLGWRRGEEELEILRRSGKMRKRKRGGKSGEPIVQVEVMISRRAPPTLGSVVNMLYHRMEAQPLGSWHTLEMTTTGSEMAWGHDDNNKSVQKDTTDKSNVLFCLFFFHSDLQLDVESRLVKLQF